MPLAGRQSLLAPDITRVDAVDDVPVLLYDRPGDRLE
jgi:hypothetical protein